MLSEVRPYRGYQLAVCSPELLGLWRVLVLAGAGAADISFFGASASREEAIWKAARKIDATLSGPVVPQQGRANKRPALEAVAEKP